jgi:hypothetical protein
MAADPKGFRVSLAKCPQCGTQFEPLCLYRVEQVASSLGVAVGTVHGWMSKGLLSFRLWARSSRSIIRVIDARDLLEFVDRRFPYPYQDPNHLASRLWGWVQKQGSKGGKKSAALRKQASILKETGGNDRTEG